MHFFRHFLSFIWLFSALSGCIKYDADTLSNSSAHPDQIAGCDDSTAFKSAVDLEPLAFLQSCFSCTATKEVPGLGTTTWKGNCEVILIGDSVLDCRFSRYEPFFEEFLKREELTLTNLHPAEGLQAIFDYNLWQQNMNLSFGTYARLLDDGDVLDAYWEIDTSCANYIEITRLDLEDREIEGEFEVHLRMKTQGSNGILYSERNNFSNAKFNARIYDFH